MVTLAFFLITSVTSLIVRVLTSSGVVLMFPLFTFLRSIGMTGADERILSLSYPWIGTARAAVAHRNVHPQGHLISAHVTKILLYYVMYEACQAGESNACIYVCCVLHFTRTNLKTATPLILQHGVLCSMLRVFLKHYPSGSMDLQ